jgi:hypothetical protein
MTEILVASAAMAWDNPVTGETTISILHQGIWFCNSFANSLIKPNQCRMHSIELCNDPFDPHQQIGIVDPVSGLELPMEYGQSFVYFTTQAQLLDQNLWAIRVAIERIKVLQYNLRMFGIPIYGPTRMSWATMRVWLTVHPKWRHN